MADGDEPRSHEGDGVPVYGALAGVPLHRVAGGPVFQIFSKRNG